jgi:murein DD-endopeptidase MepM/ murein hydrolase activator NlpD
MTADIIANQHVAKRRKPHTAAREPLFRNTVKPAFFSSDFMFKQANFKRRKTEPVNWPPPEKKLKTGFSIPVPSLATLAVIAGTLLVSLTALNWEGLTAGKKVRYWPESTEQSPIINYADSGALSILPQRPVVQEPSDVIVIQERDIPLDMAETFRCGSYVVARGDTVSGIALKFRISMDAVIASNNINNARLLAEGKVLRIPNMDGIPHTVAKGDSLSGISRTYNVPLEVILDVNDIQSDVIKEGEVFFIPGARMAPDALRLSLGELFIYPVRKSISSYYGWRADPFTGQQTFHQGIDLRGNTGTTVKAAMDGVVSDIGTVANYGNYIIIDHSNGYQTLYAHLSAFSCRLGQRIRQGDKVGEVGSTGRSTGPHLHFAVFKNGRSVNPLDLLS